MLDAGQCQHDGATRGCVWGIAMLLGTYCVRHDTDDKVYASIACKRAGFNVFAPHRGSCACCGMCPWCVVVKMGCELGIRMGGCWKKGVVWKTVGVAQCQRHAMLMVTCWPSLGAGGIPECQAAHTYHLHRLIASSCCDDDKQ